MRPRAALLALTVFLNSASHAQNISRVEAITFPLPNFELCLGLTIEPHAVFRNLDAIPRDLRVQMRIVNEVTGIRVYGDTVVLTDAPPDQQIARSFKPFDTNPNILSQLGRFRVIASVEVIDVEGNVVPESDTSDNSQWFNLFGVRRTAQPFNDASNNYSVVKPGYGGAVPDQHKWISIGATVVDGDLVTFDPPSPNDVGGKGFGPLGLVSPVLKFDRKNAQGVGYTGSKVGDTLLSYPINLQGVSWEMVTFDYHRSTRQQYGFGHNSLRLHGPERTVVGREGNVTQIGDSLLVEFRHPSDSTCGDAAARWIRVAGIDGGKDLEWQRIAIKMDTANLGLNFFTSSFRMRLRSSAKSDQQNDAQDDADVWHVDNIQLARWHHPEVTVNWVHVVTPYTKVPASQAVFPIYAKLSGVGPRWWGELPVFAMISDTSGRVVYSGLDSARFPGEGKDTIIKFPDWDARDLDLSNGSQFIVRAFTEEWFDSYPDDNDAFTRFNLNIANSPEGVHEFALDDGTNDMPAITGKIGAGVGFNSTSGSYAIRFRLERSDTLFGARVYFGTGTPSPDAIRITAYTGHDSSDVPLELIPEASLYDIRRGEHYNQFWTYHFPDPVFLEPGDYWLAVSQLALDNMSLGADVSRSGFDMIMSGASPKYQYIHRSPYGTQYDSNANSGDISRAVAFEVPAVSGNWRPFIPEYAMDTTVGFAFRGTYIPMIRPLVGNGAVVATVPRAEAVRRVSAYPNPFVAGQDRVKFTTASDGPGSSVTISNLLGQPVRRVASGSPVIEWDGRDEHGRIVTPGIYIVSLDRSEPIMLFAR